MSINKIFMAEDGPEFSRIILGFWRAVEWEMSSRELLKFIKQSIELGITTFDHADIYGKFSCEELFGDAVKIEPSIKDKIEIVTKCGIVFTCDKRPQYKFHYYDTSREHIIESVDNSLKNLRVDCIDLLLIHRADPFMNADDTAQGLSEVIESGKVKYAGVSNFSAHQFDLLQSRLDFQLVTNQIEFSAMNMTALADGTIDQCQKYGISPMAWSPLAGGKLFSQNTDQTSRLHKLFSELKDKYNAEPDQLALAWIISHPSNIFPVIGSGKIERVTSAAESCKISLSKEDWFKIWTASMGHEVP